MRADGFYWLIFQGVKQVAEYYYPHWYLSGSGNKYSDEDMDEIKSKEPLEWPKT